MLSTPVSACKTFSTPVLAGESRRGSRVARGAEPVRVSFGRGGLISHKVFIKSFLAKVSSRTNLSTYSSFIITNINDQLRDLCGIFVSQNDFKKNSVI